MKVWATAAVLAVTAASASAQDTPQAVRDPAALGVSVGAGARAWGMGGAFIAVADDGSAASWNPAGIAVLEKPEASVVWKARDRQVFNRAPFSFLSRYSGGRNSIAQTGDSAIDELSSSAFDFVSAAYPLTIRGIRVVPQFSYQRAIDQGQRTRTLKPFTSLGQTFIGDQRREEGRDFGVDESKEIRTSGDQSGGVDIWSASVGVRPIGALFVGLSLNWWRNGSVGERVESQRQASCSYDPARRDNESCAQELQTQTSATETRFRGFNVNLGLLWRVGPRLRIGAVFKTPFDMHYEERESTSTERNVARQVFIPGLQSDVVSASRSTETVNQSGPVRWPRTLGVGVAFNPRPELTLSSDVTATSWSGAVWDRTYSTLGFTPSPFRSGVSGTSFTAPVRWPTSLPLKSSPDLQEFRVSLRDQFDTYQARLGAEYVLKNGRFLVPLRAGGFLDRQYFSDGRGAPVRAWGWTAGAGVVWSFLALDVAYVRQSTSYSLDLDFTTPDDGGRVDRQRSTRDDHIGTNRVYVSGIIRF